MHTNYFYNIKTALYSSAVVMKDFNSSRKLFLAEIVTVELKAGLLLNASLRIRPLTFINEALHLSGSPFVASTLVFFGRRSRYAVLVWPCPSILSTVSVI